QNLATIGQQLQKVESELGQKAVDPSATTEDIKALQASRDDLQMRFNVIKEQHDVLEAEMKAKFDQGEIVKNSDPARKVKAKADLIRATIRQQPITTEIKQALGDDTTTGGDKFLPKTVSKDIIVEPLVKNPLR